MKPATRFVAAAVIISVGVACASSSSLNGSAAQAGSPYPALAAQRLQKMVGLTGLEALRSMPGFSTRENRDRTSRFTLVLDGRRIPDLEQLQTIRATDLFEIRVVGETESIDGDVEIVVTTLSGLRRVH